MDGVNSLEFCSSMPSSRCSHSSYCSSIPRKADRTSGVTSENQATHHLRQGQAYALNRPRLRSRKYLKSVIQDQYYERSQRFCDNQGKKLPASLPLSPCASSDSGVDFSYDSATVQTRKTIIDQNILFNLCLNSCHVQEVCNSTNLPRDAGLEDCLICINEPCYKISVDFDEPMSIIIEDSLLGNSLSEGNEVCDDINVCNGLLDPSAIHLSRSVDILDCHASSGLLDLHCLDEKKGREVPSNASGGTSLSMPAGIGYALNDRNAETIDLNVTICDSLKNCKFDGQTMCLDSALGMREPVVTGQMLSRVQPTCATVDSIAAGVAHVVDGDSTSMHWDTECANTYCTASPFKHVPLFGTCTVCNSCEGDLGAMFLSDLKINNLVKEFENLVNSAASSVRNNILSPVSCMEVDRGKRVGQSSLNPAKRLQGTCNSITTSIYSERNLSNNFLLPAWSPLTQTCSLSKPERQHEIVGKDHFKEYLCSNDSGADGSHSLEPPALQTGVICSGNVTVTDNPKFDFVDVEGSHCERLSAEPSFSVACNVPLEATMLFGTKMGQCCIASDASVLHDDLQVASLAIKDCDNSSVQQGSFCSSTQTFVESTDLCATRTTRLPHGDLTNMNSTSSACVEPREGFNDNHCRLQCSPFDSSSAELNGIKNNFNSGKPPRILKSVDMYGNRLVPEESQSSCGESAVSTPLLSSHASSEESVVDELPRISSRKTLASFCRHLSRKSIDPLLAKQSRIGVDSAALSKGKITLFENVRSYCTTSQRPSHVPLPAISSRKTLAAFFRHLSSKSLDSPSGEQSGMTIENPAFNKSPRRMCSWQSESSSCVTEVNPRAKDHVAPLPSPCETAYPVASELKVRRLSNKFELPCDLTSVNSFEMVFKRTERQYGLGFLRSRSSSLMHDFKKGLFAESTLANFSDEQHS